MEPSTLIHIELLFQFTPGKAKALFYVSSS